MFLTPITNPTLFPLRAPRFKPDSFPVSVLLRTRRRGASPFVLRNVLCHAGLATVRGPLRPKRNVEEITYTTLTKVASVFRPSRPLVDSVDNLDGEIGLKASMKSRTVYEVLRLGKEGSSQRIYVNKRDLLRAHGLKPRDLRCIEPLRDKPQSSHSFVTKNSAFLLSLSGLRCLVSKNQLLLFDPKSTPAKKFLEVVAPRLRTLAGSNQIKSLRNTRHDRDDSSQDTTTAPFELKVLESILEVALSKLESELQEVSQNASNAFSIAPSCVKSTDLEHIGNTKQDGVELEFRAAALSEILEEVLGNKDKLLRLNLSNDSHHERLIKQQEQSHSSLRMNNGVSPFQIGKDSLAKLDDGEDEGRGADELKGLLELFIERASFVESEIHRILVRVRDLETSINISLSARRYEVSRVGLMLSIVTATVALSTKVWGILGMNLKPTLEMSSMGFDDFTTFIIISCFHIFALFLNNEIRIMI